MKPAFDLNRLTHQGVEIPDPAQVWIDPRVNPDRIQGPGTILYPGTRLIGDRTYIGAGARIGTEGPATVSQSALGPGAAVCSGYCHGAVLLAGASLGANAHVREGTILEEGARTAHAVGLKQTILFPFVTLGSLINFCDCLMAGGTGPDNHSEVGSSYIHFNFTPHQDKATPSLIGDVPAGVMLDRPAIFLGGQGGMVGPCRLGFGTVAAAGTLIRKDELRCGRLLVGGPGHQGNIAYRPGAYKGLRRILINNLTYIGNLLALRDWYRQVRGDFIGPRLPMPVWQALMETLDLALDERIRRLEQLGTKILPAPDETGPDPAYERGWPALVQTLTGLRVEPPCEDGDKNRFLEALAAASDGCAGEYLRTIRTLPEETRSAGRTWLQRIVDRTVQKAMAQVSVSGAPRAPLDGD